MVGKLDHIISILFSLQGLIVPFFFSVGSRVSSSKDVCWQGLDRVLRQCEGPCAGLHLFGLSFGLFLIFVAVSGLIGSMGTFPLVFSSAVGKCLTPFLGSN